MGEVMMNEGKKWIEKDEYASKGVANTALGLSIGALGYELLKNGGLNLGNILGGNNNQTNPEETAFGLYKGYRDADDIIVAKHNQDAFVRKKFDNENSFLCFLNKLFLSLELELLLFLRHNPYQIYRLQHS